MKDFIQPENLYKEIANTRCFILPGINEAWGVVIHEFAIAELPIICPGICGANTDDVTLYKMSKNSHDISQKISPKTAAANLISLAV